jgi:hypothetical protein
MLCCPRKWSSSRFLPRTPSAFQQANRKALVDVRLGHAAILGYKDVNFKYSSWTSWPSREGCDRCEESTSELHTCLEG